MGEVFLADQMGPTGQAIRPVALKRMLPRMAKKPHAAKMFLEEMSTAAQLNHPNIATTYDFGEVDGTYFMAMEYLEGLSLHQILSALGAIPVAHALSITHKILEALDHAHRRRTHSGQTAPVVHRDVSPHNIMISTSGNVKLLDFGIARAETEALGGRLEGKIAYAAPEQLRGDNVDRRSDLWAVGVLLYESLCGVRPYEYKEAHLMEEAARQGSYSSLSSLRPEASPLGNVIGRCLKYEPNERWSDAETMLNALERESGSFAAVTPEQMASLVSSAGGPAKSVLGVENITSFGGTAVGDASNRTATIPLVGQNSAANLGAEVFYDTHAKGSVQNQARQGISKGIMVVMSTIALLLGFVIVQWMENTPSDRITSVALTPSPVAPAQAAATKAVPIKVTPTIKKTETSPAANPNQTKPVVKKAKPVTKQLEKRIPKKRKKGRENRESKSKINPTRTPIKSVPKPEPKKSVPAVKASIKAVNNSPGRLSVRSTPWAKIELNGDALGQTPKWNIKLPPGKHRLILTPGDETTSGPKVMNLIVKPDQHLRVIADFSKNIFRTLGN